MGSVDADYDVLQVLQQAQQADYVQVRLQVVDNPETWGDGSVLQVLECEFLSVVIVR